MSSATMAKKYASVKSYVVKMPSESPVPAENSAASSTNELAAPPIAEVLLRQKRQALKMLHFCFQLRLAGRSCELPREEPVSPLSCEKTLCATTLSVEQAKTQLRAAKLALQPEQLKLLERVLPALDASHLLEKHVVAQRSDLISQQIAQLSDDLEQDIRQFRAENMPRAIAAPPSASACPDVDWKQVREDKEPELPYLRSKIPTRLDPALVQQYQTSDRQLLHRRCLTQANVAAIRRNAQLQIDRLHLKRDALEQELAVRMPAYSRALAAYYGADLDSRCAQL